VSQTLSSKTGAEEERVVKPSEAVPTEIALDRAGGRVVIRWKDGHQSIYPFALLRAKCPCARCVHRELSVDNDDELPVLPSGVMAKSLNVRDIHLVGHYAVQLEWEDGHNTGIYSFELLRSLCPCKECKGEIGFPVSEENRQSPMQ